MADNKIARTLYSIELERLRTMLLSQSKSTDDRNGTIDISDLETLMPMIQANQDIHQTERINNGEVAVIDDTGSHSDETTLNDNPGEVILNNPEEYNIESFIEEVKSRPRLWNTSLRVYKEAHRKKSLGKKLPRFYKDVEFLKTQWKYLKDNLKRCLNRRKKETRSGSAVCKTSTCKYFENLIFLQDKIANRDTVSNIKSWSISKLIVN